MPSAFGRASTARAEERGESPRTRSWRERTLARYLEDYPGDAVAFREQAVRLVERAASSRVRTARIWDEGEPDALRADRAALAAWAAGDLTVSGLCRGQRAPAGAPDWELDWLAERPDAGHARRMAQYWICAAAAAARLAMAGEALGLAYGYTVCAESAKEFVLGGSSNDARERARKARSLAPALALAEEGAEWPRYTASDRLEVAGDEGHLAFSAPLHRERARELLGRVGGNVLSPAVDALVRRRLPDLPPARADGRWYGEGHALYVVPDDGYDDGYAVRIVWMRALRWRAPQ